MTATVARPVGLDRPPRADLGLLVVAVTAVSTSAPLIRAAAAPALAIAFWRNALAAGVVGPFALARAGAELRALTRRERRLAVAAGVLLAAHFGTWIPSLSFTSVASSTALVATQPVWAALLARAVGEPVSRRAWVGIGVALAGALLLSGIDLSLDPRSLTGDALAVTGGMLAAAYVTVGARVRATVTTTAYTALCYPTAAVVLLAVCLVGGVPLHGYGATAWAAIVGLTVGAQLLGHSVINRVLRTTSATVVSVSILFEILGATLIAAAFLGERPPLAALPAAALLVAGVVIVIRSGDRPADVPVD